MKLSINVKEILGTNYSCEDAILLREIIKSNINSGVELDFDGYSRISTTFLTCLFSELVRNFDRNFIFNQINVKNLSNKNDYSRVVLGTTFC